MEKAKPRHGGWTKRNRIGFMYVCIWIFGFLVFQLYPFISSLLYSFTNYDIFHAPEFVGLDNYVKLFTKDREFWNSMAVTLKYTFITVPGKVVLALIIAVILNRNLKEMCIRDSFRTVDSTENMEIIPYLTGSDALKDWNAYAAFDSQEGMWYQYLKAYPVSTTYMISSLHAGGNVNTPKTMHMLMEEDSGNWHAMCPGEVPDIGCLLYTSCPFRAFLLLLFELNHVIPDAECTEAADKAGNAAETILLHVKGRVCLFQLIVYDAQIIHMLSLIHI